MEDYSRMIERNLMEVIISQKNDKLSVKDAELVVKNKEIEEKNSTIKQLTEKLQQFQSQYHDYKATCTKIIDDQRAENLELQDKNRILSQLKDVNVKSIQELCRKVLDRDKKIEELSTKLAEVVVERNGLSKQVDFWKDEYVAKCSEYRSLEGKKDELRGQIEDLESTIEGQKEQIVDLENRINDILSLPKFVIRAVYANRGVTVVRTDYFNQLKEELEKHKRSTKENCQLRDEIEKLKDRLSSTSDKAGPYKMPDYEGFRKFADEVQREMMEELKERDNEKINNINRKLSIPAFKLPDDYAKGIWEAFFNE